MYKDDIVFLLSMFGIFFGLIFGLICLCMSLDKHICYTVSKQVTVVEDYSYNWDTGCMWKINGKWINSSVYRYESGE